MDYITGEHLTVFGRWAEGIGSALSLILIPGIKHIGSMELGRCYSILLLLRVRGMFLKDGKVSDDVYKQTSKGNEPSSSTVRSRFWINEVASPDAAEKYFVENADRMKRGLAPQRYNPDKGGMESMELSHEPIPKRDGGLIWSGGHDSLVWRCQLWNIGLLARESCP